MRACQRTRKRTSSSLLTRTRDSGRLLGLEEDGLEAYKSGGIKVQASMRSLLKLRGLRGLADKFREDFALGALAATSATAGVAPIGTSTSPTEPPEQVMHTKEGYLEKRSEWIRSFNSRFIVLTWNGLQRPTLAWYNSASAYRSGVAPRGSVELHSRL